MSDSFESIPVRPVGTPGQQPTDAPPTAQYQTPGFPPNPAYTPYQSYGYPYPMMSGPPPQLPRGLAITGMVLGIVGLCSSVFIIGGAVGIIGLIFSIIALRAVRRGQSGGKGMAIAGLATSILAIIVTASEIILFVWFAQTVTNCAQYDPAGNPQTGNQSQFDQCMRQGILGN